ncbi:MAG: hypothetical protein K8I03_13695, partial [Ignavibacteria bacterium]|nr:hypothetical protein [Ignavibacteria bacterium]
MLNSTFSQFEEDEETAKNRENIMLGQRMNPEGDIPEQAYKNAIDDRNSMTANDGYFLSSPSSWVSIGPTPAYMGSYGYCSGRGAFVKYHPSTDNTIFLGASNGGIWKTTNNGYEWDSTTDKLPTLVSGAFAIDPSDNNIMYYGTGNSFYGTIFSYMGLGLFKTTNAGQNWNQLSGGFPTGNTRIFDIVFFPDNTELILVATNTGIFRTTNAGANWTQISGTADLVCCDIEWSKTFEGVVYCSGPDDNNFLQGGVEFRKSTDYGVTFTAMNDGVFVPGSMTYISVANDGDSQDLIYAISNQSPIRLYKSTNSGVNFTAGQIFSGSGFTQADYDLFVRVSPHDKNLVYVGILNLFRSTNGGANFCCVAGYTYQGYCEIPEYNIGNCNTGGVHPDMHAIDFHPTDPNRIVLLNDGGVYQSTNKGDNWSNLNSDLATTQFFSVASNPFRWSQMSGGVQDMGYQLKGTSNIWQNSIQGGDGGSLVYSPMLWNKIIGIDNLSGYTIISEDGGTTYTGNYNIPGCWGYDPDANIFPAPHPYTPGVFYMARRNSTTNCNSLVNVLNFYKTTDNGYSWGSPINPASIGGTANNPPQNITVSSSDPNIMYMSVGAVSEYWNHQNDIFMTTNVGVNWTELNVTDFGVPDKFITHIEVDPTETNMVYLSVSGFTESGHLFKTTNGGSNWENITGNLPNIPINDFIVNYTSNVNKEIIVATDVGVFVTMEGTGGWREIATGLPNTICNDLDYNVLYGKLRVATYGRGIWELNYGENIYVKGYQFLNSDANGVDISRNIVVCSGGKLKIPYACKVNMASGKGIIVETGGTIDASSGNAITFTSQSGTWGGIEFQGTGAGTLKNCTFLNTSTPIVIESDEGQEVDYPNITIDECTFSNAPVQITNRAEVTIQNCDFTYTSGDAPTVLGVLSTGSDNVDISKNTVTSNSSITSAGISMVYGNSVSVRDNTIQNMGLGISLSNTDAFVENNTITATGDPGDNIGIGADNSYSCIINKNTVTDYFYGIKLYSSSPT